MEEVENEENWCPEIMAWQGGELEIEREEFTGFGKVSPSFLRNFVSYNLWQQNQLF
ncbi:MAG: hypothetical protein AAF383_16905 [Cyanobacteria bacterium P01_A01_bin.83]